MNNPYFPAIKLYDVIKAADQILFYPVFNNNTRHKSLDGLPRKISIGTLTTYLQDTLDFGSGSTEIRVEDEGTSLGTDFNAFNFVGPLVTATDAGSNEATVTITGSLMSSFTDVASVFYEGITDIAFDNTTTWSGNEPSVANTAAWLSDWNNNTYLMLWHPVEGYWAPAPAFDIVEALEGAVTTIYTGSDNLESNRVVDLDGKTLGFYDVSVGVTGTTTNEIRLHNHRIRAGSTTANDLQLGYFAAAASTYNSPAVRFFSNNSTDSGNSRAHLLKVADSATAWGTLELGSIGDIRLQPGGTSSVARELRLDNSGWLTLDSYQATYDPFVTDRGTANPDASGNTPETLSGFSGILGCDGSGRVHFAGISGDNPFNDSTPTSLALHALRANSDGDGVEWAPVEQSIIIAVGDETTAVTTGTAKVTFRMPYAFTVTEVRASLTGAGSTSGTTTFDINESGSTILSTKLTIDQGEKTSTTAATPAVISDASLADDAEITIDVDAVTGGADETGPKITLIGYRPA